MVVLALAALLSSIASCDDAQLGGGQDPPSDSPDADLVPNSADAAADAPVCSGIGPFALMECVSRDRYLADLTFVAEPRPPGSTHWQEVQTYAREQLLQAGFVVELDAYGTGVNVLGVRRGVGLPDEQVLVTAHYDSISDCPGADGNGSGIAGVLELARVLGTVESARTLVVALWDEEESGLAGSDDYAYRAVERGDRIVMVYNVDTIGYKSDAPESESLPLGLDLYFSINFPEEYERLVADDRRADFMFWVADDRQPGAAALVTRYADVIGLPHFGGALPPGHKDNLGLMKLRQSDHASFWAYDVPAALITDTGEFRYPQYHCQEGDDTVDLLDLDFATDIVRATVGATAELLGTR